MERLFWERGWQLFVGSCRHEYQLEITMVDEDGTPARCTWDRPDHRSQRLKFAVIRSRHARQLFVDDIRGRLPTGTRAFSVDAFVIDVRTRETVDAFHIGARVADVKTCAILASAVRSEPTRAMLAEVATPAAS